MLLVLGFGAGSLLATGPPARAAAPTYTALGDSYTSGLGTRTYYGSSGACRRSPYSYPVLNAARLGAKLTFAACAGATVADVQQRQLAGLNARTTYVTVSAGGNDAGFADVLLSCGLPWPISCGHDLDQATTFIKKTLPARLDRLYSAIRKGAPNARVAVVGYPRLFNGEQCNLVARFSPGEQARLNAAADLLAVTIRKRALAHGFGFVDARPAFASHLVCADTEWLNGLSNPINESYHPNRRGQAGYAVIVEPALRKAPLPKLL
ncbi:SGNH/GDSL hydrolase family protein [Actinopolymorpha pittospori]